MLDRQEAINAFLTWAVGFSLRRHRRDQRPLLQRQDRIWSAGGAIPRRRSKLLRRQIVWVPGAGAKLVPLLAVFDVWVPEPRKAAGE